MADQKLVEIDGLEVKFSGTMFDAKVTWKNKFTLDEAGAAINEMLQNGSADKVLSVKQVKIYRYA